MDGNITLKLQQMNRRKYKEQGEWQADVEVREGLLFLHLDVNTWNKSVCKTLQEELDKALVEFEDWGYDAIFLTSENEKSVKMWNMIKPCFKVVKLEKSGKKAWLGSWITGEGKWE